MFYSVSSPYLLVFGRDRVHGTREQMMLQVDLVRHRDGAGIAWELLCFKILEINCKRFWDVSISFRVL